MGQLKQGDLVRCITTKLKYCDFNSVYTVAEYDFFKIRLEGSKQFISIHNFAPAGLKDIRLAKLKVLSGEPVNPIQVDTGRKIDRNKDVNEKKFKLFEMLLTRWFTDRGHIGSEAWNKNEKYYRGVYFSYEDFLAKIVKTDRTFDVKLEDFETIKDMKVSEAFDLYIKMKTNKL